ncbi:hypothetical protein Tco_0835809, partial [Tanacetum coccineum]
MFAATTPENTPIAYHVSTSANPNLVISPAFVEANYEALESLLRDRHRIVGFKGTQNKGESRVERNTEGGRPSEEEPRGNGGQSVNLPPLLAAYLRRGKNGQPLQSSLTSAYGGQPLPNNIGGNLPSNEDYPLPDGLKMPSYIGSYDGKGDLDNFMYLFEWAIWMQKWLMLKKFTKTHLAVHNIKQREGKSTQALITRYTDDTLQIMGLHKEQRISGFVHGLRTKSLDEHLSTDLPSTYKGLMEKTYTWVEARE